MWIKGGGHCNLELYPDFIKQLKKFLQALGKSRPAVNGSMATSLDPGKSGESNIGTDTSDIAETSRNSLDSRLDKSKKSTKPEKSRMSTDNVDRSRRRKGFIW